jgi:hypothetical protein
MSLIATETISFEDAIALTQEFMEQIGNLSEAEKEKIVSALVASENGARGFFVTFLTSDNPLVDQESLGIINGLKTSAEIVSELLVKNVAMSTAMKITHRRNQNEEMANQSQRVTNRSLYLIEQLSLSEVKQKINDLQATIDTGEGVYQAFLSRWQYDTEQKDAIVNIFRVC